MPLYFCTSKKNWPDINEAIQLWNKNHLCYCDDKILPDFLPGGKQSMEMYFSERIKDGSAIILRGKNDISGYFTWILFNFHGEKSAFCPIIGHFGMKNDKEMIYTYLYNYASKEWIKNDVYNHLWMINYKDNLLKKFSYDMGFGSYVIDACIKNNTVEAAKNQCEITRAEKKDCEDLFNMVEESRQYYLDAPVFLKRKIIEKEEIQNIIKDNAVFLAWDNNELIGFMNIRINKGYDIENLITPESASINILGAYITLKYRGNGIGKSLLNSVFKYCNDNRIKYIHVCFETSNTYANKFWRKYFNPIVLSVRRTINKDINL
jgi:ribosomal protein S18 acetylase RimI-like enzyme